MDEPVLQDVEREVIEKQWKDRVVSQGLKPGTRTYLKAQAEFFTGAMAALKALGYPIEQHVAWIVSIMSGRDIINRKQGE